MADAYVDMSGEDESETQCRHARRRRIEVKRSATFPGEASTSAESLLRAGKRVETSNSEVSGDEKRRSTDSTNPPSLSPAGFSFADSLSVSTSSSGDAVDSAVIASSSGRKVAVNTPIAFGSVSLTGRAREMEDAISVRPGFVQFPDGCSPLHFFGVFDGHGGSHVSALCKERMHSLLAEELMRVPAPDEPVEAEETRWRSAVERCFVRMDQLALSACACGRVGEPLCRCDRSGIESEIVGSTAVVAVVGGGRLLVANCGDSRAVLSRGGRTVPLSIDQKVRDKYLKPVVISAPEIVILEITPEDECLIIASDGLWDVIPNELACNVARRCLAEGSPKLAERDLNSPTSAGEEAPISNEKDQAAPEAWCSMAAALLARLALGRRSTDNISVIVVDLRRS
ncbi:hypothetical protein KFK09_023678 [Dendrobium nobile]|uniref:protein-serine/threonine phosphatase n=1 Tax=Dendrobium nobile TaxID=94219 RepID=A0A8T3ABP7_DENNO|nr:hypothetical protein KFK09_023678 [Dendrobium nobile]